ncbi:MAG: hypothetical protein WC760_10505 [Bacteroidia bacterium]|jgi:hypothetical protein
MDEKSAISLIEQMIRDTKEEIRSNGFYFLVWGWLVFAAALANYYLLEYTAYVYHSLPWGIAIPAGIILTFVRSFYDRKNTVVRAKSFVDTILKRTIIAFSISMFLVCLTMPAGSQWKAFYPTLMVIYAIWLYLSGSILRFKPLVFGAYMNWLAAAIGYLWVDHGIHLLLIAFAVLGGFIIPGTLLEKRYQKYVQGT